MEEDPTFDLSASKDFVQSNYKPLVYENIPPERTVAREIACYLLNCYTGLNESKKQWKKRGRFIGTWTRQTDEGSKEITFQLSLEELTHHLLTCRELDYNSLNLKNPNENWLDSSVAIHHPFYAPENGQEASLTYTLPPTNISHKFPVIPALDREGAAYSSLQLILQQKILRKHQQLVEDSDRMLYPDGEWLSNLISLFNASVSLIDITMIQTYYKAQYDGASMNWNFDINKLGNTTGRRIEDKLKWIGAITGNPLSDATNERATFDMLKSVRNHFNHFDPPVLAYTIEDAAQWLNWIIDLGRFAWKIREKLNVSLSTPLIKILLLQKVNFQPRDPGKIRYPQKENVGYRSSIWKRT